jgi:DNA-directed RNA polymerase subunit omega
VIDVIKPPLEELLSQVDNKYALVMAAAKRARQLKDGALPLVDIDSANHVSVALEEIATGRVRVEEPSSHTR